MRHHRDDSDRDGGPLLRHGFVWLLAAFSSTAGLYQGYCIGLLNALSTSTTFNEAFPDLMPVHQATPDFVFVFVLGAVAGALPPIAGLAAGSLGRKATIILGALVGVVAGVLMAATPAGDVSWLYVTRFLSGMAVGVISVLVPLYQSERLIVEMETKGSNIQWPRTQPASPRRPSPTNSSMFIEEVSRLDVPTMASWVERRSRGPSRAASSKGLRPPAAATPQPMARATTPTGLRTSASLPML